MRLATAAALWVAGTLLAFTVLDLGCKAAVIYFLNR
jgi:hypothetical protein